MATTPPTAVVLLSGGLDSATTLAIAHSEGFQCCAITFDYGQRHRLELAAAKWVAASQNVREHITMRIDLRAFGGSALTANIDVPKDQLHNESSHVVPVTYVPARNIIFLSFALALAEVRDAADIFIGVNAVEYSGYPDCRPAFIEVFAAMANLGTKMGAEGRSIRIHTPLIHLAKAQIIKRGLGLGVDYRNTFSCYDPDLITGKPCGHCDSCLLRAAGFKTAGVSDPLFCSD